jgi:hypothetical protein
MNYRQLTGKTIRQGFIEFHQKNPEVYQAFEQQALRAIKLGRTKISAKLILNWIRWNKSLETTDESFKINDAYQSYYARHFANKNPQFKDCFDYRKLRNEEDGPFMTVDENGQMSFL